MPLKRSCPLIVHLKACIYLKVSLAAALEVRVTQMRWCSLVSLFISIQLDVTSGEFYPPIQNKTVQAYVRCGCSKKFGFVSGLQFLIQ